MADKADWTGDLGAEWAKRADVMERMLDPFGEDAQAALGVEAGDRVLDLGCGGGSSTFRLARSVGAQGAAVGVDVSPDLIRLAAVRRAASRGAARRAGFLLADAGADGFAAPETFDAVFSQFGAMFFDDPIPAYANIRRTMKPGARLSIVCWRAPKENDWAMAALNAARAFLPDAKPAPMFAPGPFAWSVPEKTFRRYLPAAGFRRVRHRPIDRQINLGAGVRGATALDRAVKFSLKIGPLASRLRGADKATRDKARDAVREALRGHLESGRVSTKGACWLVTAEA